MGMASRASRIRPARVVTQAGELVQLRDQQAGGGAQRVLGR
jgi:hypothetical protein